MLADNLRTCLQIFAERPSERPSLFLSLTTRKKRRSDASTRQSRVILFGPASLSAYTRIHVMSKTEILEELPRLTPEDRYEIRVKLAELGGDRWLDDDDSLTDEQKALLDARLADMEQNPGASIPWDEAKKRIEASLAK